MPSSIAFHDNIEVDVSLTAIKALLPSILPFRSTLGLSDQYFLQLLTQPSLRKLLLIEILRPGGLQQINTTIHDLANRFQDEKIQIKQQIEATRYAFPFSGKCPNPNQH
jgi:hypothetical protein